MKFILFALPCLAVATPLLELDKRQSAVIPPEESIRILGQPATSGNGCPQGTVRATLNANRTVVQFGFDAFQVYIGPQTKPADKSKNCAITVDLQYPGGYQYSILQAAYTGYARLDPGVEGHFYSTYFFSENAANTRTVRTDISGPSYVDGSVYTKGDQVPNWSTIWSPCGEEGMLNVNNRIALTSSNSRLSGELSNDLATLSFDQKLYIVWQRCGAATKAPTTSNAAPPIRGGSRIYQGGNIGLGRISTSFKNEA